nr:hypothetical protein Iba_chr15dCG3790 [Ipomoea batatas]
MADSSLEMTKPCRASPATSPRPLRTRCSEVYHLFTQPSITPSWLLDRFTLQVINATQHWRLVHIARKPVADMRRLYECPRNRNSETLKEYNGRQLNV